MSSVARDSHGSENPDASARPVVAGAISQRLDPSVTGGSAARRPVLFVRRLRGRSSHFQRATYRALAEGAYRPGRATDDATWALARDAALVILAANRESPQARGERPDAGRSALCQYLSWLAADDPAALPRTGPSTRRTSSDSSPTKARFADRHTAPESPWPPVYAHFASAFRNCFRGAGPPPPGQSQSQSWLPSKTGNSTSHGTRQRRSRTPRPAVTSAGSFSSGAAPVLTVARCAGPAASTSATNPLPARG